VAKGVGSWLRTLSPIVKPSLTFKVRYLKGQAWFNNQLNRKEGGMFIKTTCGGYISLCTYFEILSTQISKKLCFHLWSLLKEVKKLRKMFMP